jgi:hypothetical protein
MKSNQRRQPEPHALRVYLIVESRPGWKKARVIDCKLTRVHARAARLALAETLRIPVATLRVVPAIASPDDSKPKASRE